ncbi:hypothetical protein P3T76_010954 [Phytophthora citrophthora]|uniref:Uncharacterized protein n=1 Tax=Phytophthora citrophthora TaxID=4793 RepID=A0AAD9GAZ1_9STRA|nr:hypothetical protein P3T76_010954 [Phytophthora citrophthora]
MSAAGSAHNAELHARKDTSSVAQPSGRIQPTSRTTKAQQAWLWLIDRTHGRSDSQKQRMPTYMAPTEGLPLVGGDYDVVEICPWPSEVVHISHNVFYCFQPFPVSKHSPKLPR